MPGFWIFADDVPMLQTYFPYAVQLFFYLLIFLAVKEVITIYRWKLDRELMLMLNNVSIEKIVKYKDTTVTPKPMASETTPKRKVGRPQKVKPPEVATNPLHKQSATNNKKLDQIEQMPD